MNGWLAAIMRMWLSTGMNRLPGVPHVLAQSNTGQVLILEMRERPSTRHARRRHVVGLVDLLPGEAEVGSMSKSEVVQLRIGDVQPSRQKSSPSDPLVERELDARRRRRKAGFDLARSASVAAKPLAFSACMVEARRFRE